MVSVVFEICADTGHAPSSGAHSVQSRLVMNCYFLFRRFSPAASAAAALTLASVARAEAHVPAGFAVEVVAGPDAVSEPMDLTFAPDGSAWVTGRAGALWPTWAERWSRTRNLDPAH